VHDVVILAIKAVVGGCLVAGFALLSEGLSPKRFAGLFSAAPAVAIASLAVTLLSKGSHDAHRAATGMIAGAVGMIAYAIAVIPLLRRARAGAAAGLALGAWTAVAVIVAVPIMLG
jgi:uncharacterized membrane protein (GlpM family)